MSPKLLVSVLTLITLTYIVETRSSSDLTYSQYSSKLLRSLLRNRREVEDFSKPVALESWPADKEAVLTSFLETMAKSGRNITIVAWQRVLDVQGEITNLNSIQVVIPPNPAVERGTLSKDDEAEEKEEESLSYARINHVKKMLAQAEQQGLPVTASLEEFGEDGSKELLIYMNKEELFVKRKGRIAIYNKTAAITQQEVADFVDNIPKTILGDPTVLKYDTDGNVLVDQSEIQPHILGRVADHYDAPEDILLEGPKIIAKVSQQYPKEKIPRQLAIEFNLAFPEYTWRVLVDPVYYHIRKHVALTLTYDNFDFDPNTKTSYFVYGIRNE